MAARRQSEIQKAQDAIAPARPFLRCSVEYCPAEATIRNLPRPERDHLQNLCQHHYAAELQPEARAYAELHNLRTPADHIAHMRTLMPNFFMSRPFDARAHWHRVINKFDPSHPSHRTATEALNRLEHPALDREPGQDDDEQHINA